MANELTENYGFPKPNPANNINEDVIPLALAFDMVDAALHTQALAIATKAGIDHGHAIAAIDGLAAALAGKMAANRTFTLAELTDVVGADAAINNYILTKVDGQYAFRAALSVLGSHNHTQAEVSGLAAALALLAPKDSPAFTGNATAKTQAVGNNSTLLATTAFVKTALDTLMGAAPAQLDTLVELANALGNDPNFAATFTAALAAKVAMSGGTATNLTVTGYTETQAPTVTGSALSPNLANGSIFPLITNAAATITLPTPGVGKSFIIPVQYGGAHGITWAGGPRKWVDGTAPTPTSVNGKTDLFAFFADQSGSNWLSLVSGQNI